MSFTYTYKIAEFEWEFELISKLNYQTFVEEVKQHPKNKSQVLVDKFHKENTYFICLKGKELLAMISTRDKRPFSLDNKLSDLDAYFPEDVSLTEIRLLSIQPSNRAGSIVIQMFQMVRDWVWKKRHDVIVISALLSKKDFYQKIGFTCFGPVVGKKEALYQPMCLTSENYGYKVARFFQDTKEAKTKILNFLPGPVSQTEKVCKSFTFPAISHRGLDYKLFLGRLKWQIQQITKAKFSEVFMGTGTLANDVIAGQLKQLDTKGLILSNGEFGNRLVESVVGVGLDYDLLAFDFGKNMDYEMIEKHIFQNPEIEWIWFVHLETSIGILNDLNKILSIAQRNTTKRKKIKVCVDGISVVANAPVDYSQIYLASLVSGKGLSAYTGLAIVTYNHLLEKPQKTIAVYLNLYNYHRCGGIPFSGSSNLLQALVTSLDELDLENRLQKIKTAYQSIERAIEKLPFQLFKVKDGAVMVTFSLHPSLDSMVLGMAMEHKGFLLHYRSKYLKERNLLQIALMSHESVIYYPKMLEVLLETYTELTGNQTKKRLAR